MCAVAQIKSVWMGHVTRIGERALVFATLLIASFYSANAQSQPASAQCVTTAVPPQVRSEGLTELLGDFILQCSSSNPGAVITGNYTMYLPVGVTNRQRI